MSGHEESTADPGVVEELRAALRCLDAELTESDWRDLHVDALRQLTLLAPDVDALRCVVEHCVEVLEWALSKLEDVTKERDTALAEVERLQRLCDAERRHAGGLISALREAERRRDVWCEVERVRNAREALDP